MLNKPEPSKVPFKPFEGSSLSLFGKDDCLYVGLSKKNIHLAPKLAQETNIKFSYIWHKVSLVTFWKFDACGWIEANFNIKAQNGNDIRKQDIYTLDQKPLSVKLVIFDSSSGSILEQSQMAISGNALDSIKRYARLSLADSSLSAYKAHMAYLELAEKGGTDTLIKMYEPLMHDVQVSEGSANQYN